MNLRTLDTVIAMIIVLLVLSLIVQSIQSLIKKWFKLKSRSIFNSLEDLFKYVQSTPGATEGDGTAADTLTTAEAKALVVKVQEEFKKLGRVSFLRQNPMVDSIAKEDLLKILDRIGKSNLKAQVGDWFDTVMHSFEERYTRHMKTVAICVSVLVVIFFNANFFQVYRNISTNDVLRNSLVERQTEIQKQLDEQSAQTSTTPTEVTPQQLREELKQLRQTMDDTVSLGFTPLRPAQIIDFVSAKGVWQGYPASQRLAHLLKVLAGWAIMVMLLSVGAPFWQDALESLFGIKNLIRQKSATQNVEDTGGQPKP